MGFDEQEILLAHPKLYDETSLLASLHEIFWGYFPREEPLLVRDVSWAIDARLFGFDNPFGYRLGNVLLNALNASVLFLFLRHATRRMGLALAISAVFAVLPVHVEPVCWIMGRKDLLAASFVLLALLVQSHELQSADTRRRLWLYLASLLCVGLALFSKIATVTAFAVLAMHRILHAHLSGQAAPGAPLPRGAALCAIALRTLPHAALSVGAMLWYQGVIAEHGVIGDWRGPGPGDPTHLLNVALFAPLVLGLYVKHLIWPTQLSLFYRWPHVEIPLSATELAGSAALGFAAIAGVAFLWMRRRDLAFYALAFLALMLPYANLIYVGIWSANRYVYLSSFCLLALAATPLRELWLRLRERAPQAALAIPALVVAFGLGSAAKSAQLQSAWRDPLSLWSYEVALDEPSLIAIQALAKVRLRELREETDPERRARVLARVRALIQRGFERERAMGRQPSPYRTSDQLQLARLHYLQGRIAALEGAPLQTQLRHYLRAHQIAPDRLSAVMLAETYFRMAQGAPHPQPLLRKSLAHFELYVQQSRSDPVAHARSLALLERYYGHIASLRRELDAIRQGAR